MTEPFINRARVRFIVEKCGREAWSKMVETFFASPDNYFLKFDSFTGLVFHHIKDSFVSDDSIYVNGLGKNKTIWIFDLNGNLTEKRNKRLFFDSEFNKKKKEISLEGNLQVRERAKDLVLNSSEIFEYTQANPGEYLRSLSNRFFERKDIRFIYNENCFKLDCYSLGADVVLDYSVNTGRGFNSYLSNFRGNLYKRIETNLEKSLLKN